MSNKLSRKIFISLFALLYISVALVSTYHAVYFFGLANVSWIAVMLAITFEIGQAAVLFSILTGATGKRKILPWVLMITLTLVQVLGNVYSSYKYLITNSESLLRYFKEPIFVWMELPDAQANVILTYIIGAILPIVSLLMTGMVTNYLEKSVEDEPKNSETEPSKMRTIPNVLVPEIPLSNEKPFPEVVPGNVVTIPNEEVPVVSPDDTINEPTNDTINDTINDEPVEETDEPVKETDELREVLKAILGKDTKNPDELTLDEVKNVVKAEQEKQQSVEQPKRKSHFVNMENKNHIS